MESSLTEQLVRIANLLEAIEKRLADIDEALSDQVYGTDSR